MWGSIDGASSGRAKQNLKDGAVAVIVLIGSYVIIGTIVGVLGGSSIKTDLNTYFFVNTDLKTKAPAATPAAPVKPGDTTKPADPAKPDPAKPAAPAK